MLKRAKEILCEQPLKRWIHADGSKLSMKDSIKIVGQLGQIAWTYRTKNKSSQIKVIGNQVEIQDSIYPTKIVS